MLIAEELDADWDQIEVRTALPGPKFLQMRTSGSWSVGGFAPHLRKMGARTRALLVAAAARRWNVEASTCRTEAGRVLHDASNRSLGYGDLAADAAKLPLPDDAPLKPKDRFRMLGRPMQRYDGAEIVTGAARYGIDVRVDGMRFAAIARCPVIGGRPQTVDDADARKLPGVVDVIRLDHGVAVVASDTWAALRARDALRVTWDEGSLASFDSRAYRRGLAEATQGRGSVGRNVGDVESTLGSAAQRLEQLYEYPFFAHAPIEPMNALADVGADGCDLWLGTQAPNWVQEDIAKLLGLEPAAVRVHVQLAGGGFGRRLGVEHALEAAAVSKRVSAPVQVVWTRADDMQHGFFQPAAAHRMVAGLDGNGRIVGWWHREASSTQNYRGRFDPENPDIAAIHMWGGVDNPYVLGAMRAEFILNEAPIPLGPWRAVFAPSNVMARECFLDEIAHATGKDPVAMRLTLLAEDDGADEAQRALRRRLAAVIRLAADKAGWPGRRTPGRALGIAAHIYDGETTMAQVAEVSLESGVPRVHRFVCAIDCGFVVNPLGLEAQVESGVVWGLSQTLGGEITLRNGRVEQSSFGDYPILRITETPTIETYTIEGVPQPLGAGEQPVAPVAAAVLNALFRATGRRIRHLPVRAADFS
jgi:CO/xanthine dehydrogenase Mo-binding subunit